MHVSAPPVAAAAASGLETVHHTSVRSAGMRPTRVPVSLPDLHTNNSFLPCDSAVVPAPTGSDKTRRGRAAWSLVNGIPCFLGACAVIGHGLGFQYFFLNGLSSFLYYSKGG